MRRISRLDETPVFFPHPLAVEVARCFPAHWEFGWSWWLEHNDVCIPVNVGTLRVYWPRIDHPDAHSWRVVLDRGVPYSMRRFNGLDEMPHAAAEAIMAYANRGRDWQKRRRALLAKTLPTWLQAEIDCLMNPAKETAS